MALDSNVFVYALGFDQDWARYAHKLLKQMEAGELNGVASSICLIEVLAKPFQHSPEAGQVAQLYMESLQGVDFFPMDLETGMAAARLRGMYGRKLRPIDAMHAATALVQQAEVLVTNDYEFAKLNIEGLRIVRLGEPLA